MLFKISLASLDGPLLESAFGGGERADAVVEGFPRASRVPFAPYWSWEGWLARRVRELCSEGSILPFASRLESA